MQPDVGHEVLWVVRDVLSGEILLARSLLSATEADLVPLLQEALNLMEPAKIVGLVFNGDDRHVSRGFYASKQRRGFRGMTNGKQTAVDG